MSHCNDHSGHCERLKGVEEFRDRQEGKGGINERLFDKLETLHGQTRWILGGIATLGFVLTLCCTLVCAYLSKIEKNGSTQTRIPASDLTITPDVAHAAPSDHTKKAELGR